LARFHASTQYQILSESKIHAETDIMKQGRFSRLWEHA